MADGLYKDISKSILLKLLIFGSTLHRFGLGLLILHKNSYMFTQGQLIFGILFAVVFVLALIYAYRKDLKLHRKYYKGNVWVLVAFIGFIAMMATLKFIFT